ncbi:acetolactate synthase small subunit [Bacillus pseudomycoides]|uniref:Acetolactate synthase small subunit n=2 Tax=Bacillus pseudomycoides TaxID=64104 RepID=A0ABD6SZS4_9BACI|nr:acetolactate synthase small subunit [Bacillus pseudomycoides]PDZ70495.1 acetolactate synthase small subunit [Bacillus pseudomycoides]PEJ27586.1 acetolactate synthase small subunit [Bacillus pseudomycoides]PEK39625.1 acetolactate synthase small subunit [Bacillus pseudomycoides]PEK66412.1 acetolactate synthase small subunit [Bacillus pseudomycoides]
MGRMSHTFSLVVNNDPGVLLRVSGIFARRCYNISSLNLNEGETREVSKMKLTVACTEKEAVLLVNQLKKLIDVLQVNKL